MVQSCAIFTGKWKRRLPTELIKSQLEIYDNLIKIREFASRGELAHRFIHCPMLAFQIKIGVILNSWIWL